MKKLLTFEEDKILSKIIENFGNKYYIREVVEDSRDTIYKEDYRFNNLENDEIYEIVTLHEGEINEETPTNFKGKISKIHLFERKNVSVDSKILLTCLFIAIYGFESEIIEIDSEIENIDIIINRIKRALPDKKKYNFVIKIKV